ncbi:MAG: AAA family ATPase, partial [Sneathiellales bacterium]|nr:AAA family ATPase [Sneathiellales bacterium]
MAKNKKKVNYVCQVCGAISARWQGKCSNCDTWDSLVEEIEIKDKNSNRVSVKAISTTKLSDIKADEDYRIKTNIVELDRALGGGVVPGSLILLAGEPGIGKSTLTLQMLKSMDEFNPLYITGEESLQQIKFRANRIGIDSKNLQLLAETNLDLVLELFKTSEYKFLVIDSIQSIYTDKIDSTPG